MQRSGTLFIATLFVAGLGALGHMPAAPQGASIRADHERLDPAEAIDATNTAKIQRFELKARRVTGLPLLQGPSQARRDQRD